MVDHIEIDNIKFDCIDPTELRLASFRLARKIYNDGFIPTHLIVLWRGGTPVGLNVHEYFEYKLRKDYPDEDDKSKRKVDHIAIRTSSYEGLQKLDGISVHGLNYIVKNANKPDRILIVDDIFDSGRTVKTVIDHIKSAMRLNTPDDIRVATLFYKEENRTVDFEPNYFEFNTSCWVDFPHELKGLTDNQILMLKGKDVYDILIS